MYLSNNTFLQGGKYKIVRFISSGGFGCTYEAIDTMMDTRVAIKEFFVKDYCNRDEVTKHITLATQSKRELIAKLRKKFLEEARAIFQMKHDNIVRVYSFFEENNTAYYVMEFIEGESLGDMLKRRGSLSETEALDYIRQVADALRYVHSKNRLHLDIKPGNIMIGKNGKAVLIDFGASKHYDEGTGENTTTMQGLNTPGYAPYEQTIEGVTEFKPASDIYALGATLYKALTGITPPNSGLLAIHKATLSPLPSHISESTKKAIVSALQLHEENRPSSIDAFLKILTASSNKYEKIGDNRDGRKQTASEVNDESTMLFGQPNPSTEKIASVKPQAFNIDQYKVPGYFSNDPKDTERRAVSGNKEAMFAYAMMLLRGEGKSQDYDAAYRWLNTCKNNGDGRAVALLNNWEFLKKKYKKEEKNITSPEQNTSGKKSMLSGCLVWSFLAAIIIYFFTLTLRGNGNNNYYDNPKDSIYYSIDSTYVENYEVNDTTCTYYWTGYVRNGLPTGDGKAKYSSNDYYGRKEYSGKMTVGVRQDENAILTFRNGDYYQGSFDYDYFKKGTYYSFSTGEKFVGTFSSNQPYNGKWYDKNGNVVGTVKNGR